MARYVTRMRIIMFCLTLLAATPIWAQDADTQIAATQDDSKDGDIATRLRDILTALDLSSDITVLVNDGVVTLRGTASSPQEATQASDVATRIEGVVTVRNEVTATNDLGRQLDPAVDRFKSRIDQLVRFLPLAAVAALVFALIVIAGFAIARMRRPWDHIAPNMFIADLYRQLLRLGFVIAGLVAALDIMNASALLSTILGAAGIIGLALGFAVRDTVENFIASIMLSIRQPFRPHDTVEINGDQGRVIRLTSRATILLSFDGNHIRIPNATVFKSRIVNFSRNEERRFKFSVLIDRDTDLQAARDLIETTIQNLPFVLPTPAASVWIDTLGTAGADMIATGWVNQNDTSIVLAKGEAIRHVKSALQTAGVALPDASQTVVIQRQDASPPAKPEGTNIARVNTQSDDELTHLIEAERIADPSEDLLRADAETE